MDSSIQHSFEYLPLVLAIFFSAWPSVAIGDSNRHQDATITGMNVSEDTPRELTILGNSSIPVVVPLF